MTWRRKCKPSYHGQVEAMLYGLSMVPFACWDHTRSAKGTSLDCTERRLLHEKVSDGVITVLNEWNGFSCGTSSGLRRKTSFEEELLLHCCAH